MVELGSDFAPTNDTSYIAVTSELWGVFHELFEESRPRHRAHSWFGKAIYNYIECQYILETTFVVTEEYLGWIPGRQCWLYTFISKALCV